MIILPFVLHLYNIYNLLSSKVTIYFLLRWGYNMRELLALCNISFIIGPVLQICRKIVLFLVETTIYGMFKWQTSPLNINHLLRISHCLFFILCKEFPVLRYVYSWLMFEWKQHPHVNNGWIWTSDVWPTSFLNPFRGQKSGRHHLSKVLFCSILFRHGISLFSYQIEILTRLFIGYKRWNSTIPTNT